MHDLSFEFLHPLNIRPLEVVQDTGAMEEHVTSIFEEASASIRLRLLQFDEPLARFLLPIASDDLSVEGHVLAQAPYLAHLVEIFPDIRRV